MEKIYIEEIIKDLTEEINGSIEQVISLLKKEKKVHIKNGYRNISLKSQYSYETTEIELWGERLENTTEFNKRIKLLEDKKKRELKKEEKEKELFTYLSKKYKTI